MRTLFVARPRSGPEPAELVPLSERAMYLELVRIGFASVVIAWAALAPTIAISRAVLAASALAYVAVAAVPQMLRRLGKHRVKIEGNGQGFDLERMNLDVDELERIGPAIVMDFRGQDGIRVLVWTQ